MESLKKAIKKHPKMYSFFVNLYVWLYEFIRDKKRLYYMILGIKVFLNKKHRLSKYEFMSIKEYCIKYNQKYITIEKEQEREVAKPNYYGRQEDEQIQRHLSPEIYIAELANVEIIGGNSFINADKFCLYDMALADQDNRYDLRFGSLKIIDGKNAIQEYIEKEEVIEQAIFLVGFASFNYYHVTLELLSRLQYIDQFEEYRTLPILVDQVVLEIPQYKELLQKVNSYHHPIIQIEEWSRYGVKKLIYPSNNTWMPINIKKRGLNESKDFLIAKSAVDYIRNCVLDETEDEACRKIFISRKNSRNKRLVNEEEIRDLFVQHGFEIIYPEELTFQEQIKVFSQAKFIAGPTGAAFTNVLYCPKDATVICLLPKEYNFYMWSTIANLINVKSMYLDTKIIKKTKNISGDQFKLDLKYSEDYLKTI